MVSLLIHLSITVLLEYLVLLYFFRKEYWPCLQFAVLMNAVSLLLALFMLNQLGFYWWLILPIIIALEALGIYFFWVVKPSKAALISFSANVISAGVLALMGILGWRL